MAVSGYQNIKLKEIDNFKKYTNFLIEVVRMSDVQITIVQLLFGHWGLYHQT